ncbi:MAG TPA: sulfurtransferase [Candidatus Dormibacteraeota bacterium]|nr:sulfurtransferase [Candidatus Dormibacteraeota bacterium]
MSAFGPLVDAAWLREHIADRDLRVLDFRWYLVGRKGAQEYAKGHIPGAVFVELDDVTGRGPGRHPLPTAGQFQAAMRKAGVDDATAVVVYDDVGGSVAARLWFLLRWFGHGRQAVLDGGLQAWGDPIETAAPHIGEGDFTARMPDRSRILDFDEVARHRGVPLIDSRAGERYRGEKEPVDPKAGHIPGARSAPFTANLGEDGRFKSGEQLRRRFAEVGVDPEQGAVVYCGSGVNACHNLLAMELAGVKNVRLYEGSWSDWSSRDAPIAMGSEPG